MSNLNNILFSELSDFVLSKPAQKIELEDAVILDTHIFTLKSIERVKWCIDNKISPNKDFECRTSKRFLFEIQEKLK
jgi:hypothetical protein